MRKPFIILISITTAGVFLLGGAHAQQNPAANPPKAPVAASPATPAAKAAATKAPAAKTTPSAATKPQNALVLKTEKDKTSYALGMNLGKGLQVDSVEVDPDILLRGIKDAMSGAKPLMTEEEAQASLMQLQAAVTKKREEELQQAGEMNKQAGEMFLAANKTKDGVVTLPSGLQYKILTAGTGPIPTLSDTVVCNYRGTLLDGTEFDSSYKRGQPATFPVNGIIKGWTEALQLMPVGSKWQLFIPSDLAYGDRSPSPVIGLNSTLVFEVELLSIQGKGQQ